MGLRERFNRGREKEKEAQKKKAVERSAKMEEKYGKYAEKAGKIYERIAPLGDIAQKGATALKKIQESGKKKGSRFAGMDARAKKYANMKW